MSPRSSLLCFSRKKSQDARAELYASDDFRVQVGLHLDRPREVVDLCFDALTTAGVIPALADSNAAALAADAAGILMAVGSRRSSPAGIFHTAKRFNAMPLFANAGSMRSEGPADPMRDLPCDFGHALEKLFLNLWSSLLAGTADGYRPTSVLTTWADELGILLFGTIQQKSSSRRMIYSNAKLPRPMDLGGSGSIVKIPDPLGGTEFGSIGILRVAMTFKTGVLGTDADIQPTTTVMEGGQCSGGRPPTRCDLQSTS